MENPIILKYQLEYLGKYPCGNPIIGIATYAGDFVRFVTVDVGEAAPFGALWVAGGEDPAGPAEVLMDAGLLTPRRATKPMGYEEASLHFAYGELLQLLHKHR